MSLQKYHNSNEHYGDALAQLILSSPEERDAAKRELLQRGRELSRAAIDLNVELRHPEYMIPENQKPEATNPDAQSGLSSASLLGRTVEWEIVLAGDHPDIFLILEAPENATDNQLLQKACDEAMQKTYLWLKKRVRPNADIRDRADNSKA